MGKSNTQIIRDNSPPSNSMQRYGHKNCHLKNHFMKQIIVITPLVFLITSCKKNKVANCYPENANARIIGYDPCRHFLTFNKVAGAGFVIEIDKGNSKDTVVTYSVPEGVFDFQSNYIDASYSSYLFKPNVQDLFRIKFSYREVTNNEKTFVVCNGMINTAHFFASVKGREIFILCISKQ